MRRKISISIPLNDPSEYEGGELQFNAGGLLLTPDQEKGKALMFPSWMMHRVTPVTLGRRYSMVVWIHGPNWS
ncbi:2OG-Fe(II) oxygenase [Oceanicoccus sp. KOV_DT_Chl]|uniref:2OG-Fe(II) oxygenase n=1 Tax=Oceanicoccus sp. KOV_DT_Chl TaxID=1904639 RepID=UPI00350F78C1